MQLITIHRIPLTVLAITVLPITAFGQVNDNLQSRSVRIVGRVIDATKAGIPNVLVTLKVPGVDETVAEVRSDKDGHFYFPSVSAQAYEMRFESPGFELLTFQTKRAAEGGDHDIGIVELRVGMMGDPVEIFKPPSTPESPINTTLCELVKDRDHFHGEFVQLRAAVYPSGAGVTPRLIDSSCGANVGLSFSHAQSITAGKDLPLLKRYTKQHRVIVATVCGKFEIVPVYHGDLTYTLRLVAASNLILTPGAVSGSRRNRR